MLSVVGAPGFLAAALRPPGVEAALLVQRKEHKAAPFANRPVPHATRDRRARLVADSLRQAQIARVGREYEVLFDGDVGTRVQRAGHMDGEISVELPPRPPLGQLRMSRPAARFRPQIALIPAQPQGGAALGEGLAQRGGVFKKDVLAVEAEMRDASASCRHDDHLHGRFGRVEKNAAVPALVGSLLDASGKVVGVLRAASRCRQTDREQEARERACWQARAFAFHAN